MTADAPAAPLAAESPLVRCRAEFTGVRPTAFSKWHRAELPADCWCADIDLVEIRKGRGVVLIAECSEVGGSITEGRVRAISEHKRLQIGVVRELAQARKVSGLYVVHNPDMAEVGTLDVTTGAVRLFDGESFAKFIEAL